MVITSQAPFPKSSHPRTSLDSCHETSRWGISLIMWGGILLCNIKLVTVSPYTICPWVNIALWLKQFFSLSGTAPWCALSAPNSLSLNPVRTQLDTLFTASATAETVLGFWIRKWHFLASQLVDSRLIIAVVKAKSYLSPLHLTNPSESYAILLLPNVGSSAVRETHAIKYFGVLSIQPSSL